MHPVSYGGSAVAGGRLGYLAFVVGKFEIHAASVDVELRAEIFLAHGGAFEVPAGESFAPRRRPVHDVLGRGFFPQGEVGGIVLLGLSVELARGGEKLVDVAAREASVAEVAVEFGDVEVYRSFAYVSVAGIENLLYVFDLLDDVT